MLKDKVGIILLNWNGWRETLVCVKSLERLEYPNYMVIVVDNCSVDDSILQLSSLDNIHLVKSDRNRGFAGGCNLGIKYALENDCRYVWLLNNDTEVFPGSLLPMVKLFENNTIGMVGSVLYHDDNGLLQAYGGSRYNKFIATAKPIKKKADLHKLNYLCGASVLISAEVINAVGLWDERFFVYWEDADYSSRVVSSGYELAVALDSKILHYESSTCKKLSEKMGEYNTMGMTLFYRKRRLYLALMLGISGRLIKRFIMYDFKGLQAVVRGFVAGFKFRL